MYVTTAMVVLCFCGRLYILTEPSAQRCRIARSAQLALPGAVGCIPNLAPAPYKSEA